RLPLVAYIMTFPLTAMVHDARWGWKTIAFLGITGSGIILFGKELFSPREATELLASRWETVGNDASRAITDVAIELSFPYVTLANSTLILPSDSPYRLFV